jgi:hypothetical protein
MSFKTHLECYNGCCACYIERIFEAIHGYFDQIIAQIHGLI